ncbi:MAG: polysaccharide deacetylase family protein [Candidatus Omnitrophota bacterium]|nr:polysaccharide deacetylase family protein [Candidatus Omnitrophota bacterium]
MKKLLLTLFSLIIILGAFYFFWFTPRYTVPILVYHSIGYGEGGFFVKPENFIKQMAFIKKNGYEVITLDELVRSIKDKKSFKRNKIVITIDDGYKDNFQYAYPVLKKFGFPATIFLVTDYIGKGFLNWDEVIAMSKDNIAFGGHTKTHFYLGVVKDEKAAFEEIAGSKKAIEEKIGLPVDYFCYPSGGFNEKAKKLVMQAGYKGACTTNRGFAKFNRDVYELKRIKVTNSDTNKLFSFWAKLSGYYNILRREKRGY